jgi:hypothetical protein
MSKKTRNVSLLLGGAFLLLAVALLTHDRFWLGQFGGWGLGWAIRASLDVEAVRPAPPAEEKR